MSETVRDANNSPKTTKSVHSIVCHCGQKAERAGAQDECDHYVCPDKHLTKYRLLASRPEWKEEK